MIVDRLENLHLYCGILPQLDTAIAFAMEFGDAITSTTPMDLPADAGYAFYTEYRTEAAAERRYEAHRRYIDIQIPRRGTEHCFVADQSLFTDADSYDAEKDLQFFNDAPADAVSFTFSPGMFAIFFPHDTHKPACADPTPATVAKCVIKVNSPAPSVPASGRVRITA